MAPFLADSLDDIPISTTDLARLSRTRVAFITDVPTPYVVALLNELGLHIDLRVIFCSSSSTRGMSWTLDDLRFISATVGGWTIRRNDSNGTDYYLSLRLLVKLARLRPSVIISAGFSLPSFYAYLYCLATGSSLIIYSDGTRFTERHFNTFQLFARRFLIPRCAVLIAKSRQAANNFSFLGGAQKTVIAHHTTNLEPFLRVGRERLTSKTSERAELQLLSVGRLIRRKGTHLLIDALSILPPTARPVRLTVIGTGPEEENLKRMAEEKGLTNVSFAGFVEHALLPAYFSTADVFVLPTLQDPFAIVMLEAAASGLALLGSIFAGASDELVIAAETGLRFDPRSPSELACSIAELANSPETVHRMGACAHAASLARTPQRSSRGYLAAILNALK